MSSNEHYDTAQSGGRPATQALHFLCGKIAAGKSTLAKILAAPPLTILVAEDQWLGLLYPGEITTLDDYVRCSKRLRDAMEPHIISMLAEAKCRGRTCFSNQ